MPNTGAPYKIEKRGSKFVVLNNLGEVKATFDSMAKARDYQAALYANVPGAAKRAKNVPFTGKQKRAVRVKADELPRHPFVQSASDSRRCLACGELSIHMIHVERSLFDEMQVRDEGAAMLKEGLNVVSEGASVAGTLTVQLTAEEMARWLEALPSTLEVGRDFSPEARKRAANAGHAMSDGSFPIKTVQDLKNAIQAVGRAKNKASAIAHIKKRAKALGAENVVPIQWRNGAGRQAALLELNGKTLLLGPGELASSQDLAANKHFGWMAGRFIGAEKANRNGAYWSTEDLQFGAPTVSNGPLNWLHDGKHVIGTLARQQLVTRDEMADVELDEPRIEVASVVWKWLAPEEWSVMEMASDAGKLYYSMECVSDTVQCRAGCDANVEYADYIGGQGLCEHMAQRAERRFANPTFLGGAVIVPPVRPGWAEANATLIKQAAAVTEKAYEELGQPDISSSEFELMIAGVFAQAGA